MVFFFAMPIANGEEGKIRAAGCDPGHTGALVTDHHRVRFLHWVITTCNSAAFPLRVQLLEKANFIYFSSPAVLQLVS